MKISQLLAGGRPSISFEFFPPKTPEGEASLMRTIDALRPLQMTPAARGALRAHVQLTEGRGD